MKFEEKIKINLTEYKFMDCLKKYSKMLLTNPETLKRHMYGFEAGENISILEKEMLLMVVKLKILH